MQVYICGESDSVELPDDPLSIKPRASAMKSLQASPHPLCPSVRQRPERHDDPCMLFSGRRVRLAILQDRCSLSKAGRIARACAAACASI